MPDIQQVCARGFVRIFALGLVVAMSMGGVYVLYTPPESFQPDTTVVVEQGSSVRAVAEQLQSAGTVRSTLVVELLVRIRRVNIQAGEYVFAYPQSTWRVVDTLAQGTVTSQEVTVTIPEGSASYQIAEILSRAIDGFEKDAFMEHARTREGYLFPDTYRFFLSASAKEVMRSMEDRFHERIAEVADEIAASPYTLHEILTIASLLEKEARQFETMRMVTGVLYNRLAVDMPLQVDAVFGYILETDTFHPGFEDLLIDSPYNTYRYAGLPPGPINNPGLVAIRAALDPIEHTYLFYLTGRDGVMYYAETYVDHVVNRRRHLD